MDTKKIILYTVSYVFASVSMYIFIVLEDKTTSFHAFYWFYTSLFCALLPQLIASGVMIKSKYFQIDLTDKFDRLTKATEEQSLKVISSALIELSSTDYYSQLARIISKEHKKHPNINVCIIYADVDNLKQHLAGTDNGRLMKVRVLEYLNKCLEDSAVHFQKPYDIYSLTLREPDAILIVRRISFNDGIKVAEHIRQKIISNSKGNESLELPKERCLTASLAVSSWEGNNEPISEENAKRLHRHTLDILDKAKSGGKNHVESEIFNI
jgi:GGDEF domain-containing protein